MNISENPIVQRLTRSRRWPKTLSENVIVLFVLFIVGALIAGAETFVVQLLARQAALNPRFFAGALLVTPLRVLVFLVPIILTVTIIFLVSRDVVSEDFQMLRLTNLARKDIIRGYSLVGLFRMRIVLAIVLGSVVATAVFGSIGSLINASVIFDEERMGLITILILLQAVVSLLRFAISIWLAVALGLVLGLRIKTNPAIGVVLAVFVFLTLAFIQGVGRSIATLAYGFGSSTFSSNDVQFLTYGLVTNAIVMVISVIIAGLSGWLARGGVPLSDE